MSIKILIDGGTHRPTCHLAMLMPAHTITEYEHTFIGSCHTQLRKESVLLVVAFPDFPDSLR
jgi:hypothetical protein